MTEPSAVGHLDHAVASRPAEGEWVCGDRALVVSTPGGVVGAVVDGLGHGPDAAHAAQRAANAIAGSRDGTPIELLRRCDTELRRSRGAAISIVAIATSGGLRWGGVGNVSGRVVACGSSRSYGLVTAPGIVGSRLPRLRDHTAQLADGDLVVLFTDGIADAATADLTASPDPQTLANLLLQRHATGGDDACVLVLRYRGAPG